MIDRAVAVAAWVLHRCEQLANYRNKTAGRVSSRLDNPRLSRESGIAFPELVLATAARSRASSRVLERSGAAEKLLAKARQRRRIIDLPIVGVISGRFAAKL